MNGFRKYINDNAVPAKDISSLLPELYLDVMERSIAAYDLADIENKFNNPIYDFQDIFMGYSRIGMARLLNVMAFLIKEGRLEGVELFWSSLMNAVLDDILKQHPKSGVEFLVLETCTALYVMGTGIMDYQAFISKLRAIEPYKKYDSTLGKKPPEKLFNFCMYGICAEFLRGLLTGEDTDEFITGHWEIQKRRFNQNGRYMDPGCPMVYDLTSRYRLALMLKLGYKGKAAGEMRDILIAGAYNLLFQMSSDSKFPYGGRSNQFNFNECLASSMFEYYAAEIYSAGDYAIAGVFRHMAVSAVKGLSRWLDAVPARHIKNMYPVDSSYGIDSYGTYERYMGTMGAFMSGALLFMNDSIPLYKIPAGADGHLMSENDEFHKIYASAGGYSMEIDPAADQDYDSTGLGRLHFAGAPSEIAISMPFSKSPGYLLGAETNCRARSLGAYWEYGGKREYLAESMCSYGVSDISEGKGKVEFSVNYSVINRGRIEERYTINDDGVKISCTSDFADISYCVPVFKFNGKNEGIVSIKPGFCSVILDSWVYSIIWERDIPAEFRDCLLYNRNGVYRELNIQNNNKKISIYLSITRSGK